MKFHKLSVIFFSLFVFAPLGLQAGTGKKGTSTKTKSKSAQKMTSSKSASFSSFDAKSKKEASSASFDSDPILFSTKDISEKKKPENSKKEDEKKPESKIDPSENIAKPENKSGDAIEQLVSCQIELAQVNFLANQIIDQKISENIKTLEKLTQKSDLKKDDGKTDNKAPENKSVPSAPSTVIADGKKEEPKLIPSALITPKPVDAGLKLGLVGLQSQIPSEAQKILSDIRFKNPELRKLEIENQILLASQNADGLSKLKQSMLALNKRSQQELLLISGDVDQAKILDSALRKDPSLLSDAEKLMVSQYFQLEGLKAISQDFLVSILQAEQKEISLPSTQSLGQAGNTMSFRQSNATLTERKNLHVSAQINQQNAKPIPLRSREVRRR